MIFTLLQGVKNIKELVPNLYNAHLNALANWWNAHDAGNRIWTKVNAYQLLVPEATNYYMGVSTLVAGTVVVANTSVTATSRIFLTPQNASGTAGSVSISARTAGTSFTILSTNAADTRDVAWLIVTPG